MARGTIEGPLTNGGNGLASIPVADLVGRHQVRVVVDGAQNSPLHLGTLLQLDRTPPTASLLGLTPAGGTVTGRWTQSDGLSGTDPAAPVIVEVNASAAGDAAGG